MVTTTCSNLEDLVACQNQVIATMILTGNCNITISGPLTQPPYQACQFCVQGFKPVYFTWGNLVPTINKTSKCANKLKLKPKPAVFLETLRKPTQILYFSLNTTTFSPSLHTASGVFNTLCDSILIY